MGISLLGAEFANSANIQKRSEGKLVRIETAKILCLPAVLGLETLEAKND